MSGNANKSTNNNNANSVSQQALQKAHRNGYAEGHFAGVVDCGCEYHDEYIAPLIDDALVKLYGGGFQNANTPYQENRLKI